MSKNNLMKVFIFLSVFFMLITPLIYSKEEPGAGTVISDSLSSDTDSSISSETTYSSPKDITKPVEFPEGYEDLLDKEEKTIEDLEAIEEIEKENHLGCVTVGDVKIPLNTETHDGNIGATEGSYELKGSDLHPFKTLTSRSGKVTDVSRASNIKSISIKEGEVIEIIFNKIDGENKENMNEVLIAEKAEQGLWFSPPKEDAKEEGHITFEDDLLEPVKGLILKLVARNKGRLQLNQK